MSFATFHDEHGTFFYAKFYSYVLTVYSNGVYESFQFQGVLYPASSRIWTRFALSISNDNNHYSTGTFSILFDSMVTFQFLAQFPVGPLSNPVVPIILLSPSFSHELWFFFNVIWDTASPLRSPGLLYLEFFTSTLPDGLLLEIEWQQVYSSLQDSSQYSGRLQ